MLKSIVKSMCRIAGCIIVLTMTVMAGGCISNTAYYLESAGRFRSWDELNAEALRICRAVDNEPGSQLNVRDVKHIAPSEPSADLSIQSLLEPLTLTLVPARFCSIHVWEARCGDWTREIQIREVSHESLWPTGVIPASFGADRRVIHCPDTNKAFKAEEAFAKDIARALYSVDTNGSPDAEREQTDEYSTDICTNCCAEVFRQD